MALFALVVPRGFGGCMGMFRFMDHHYPLDPKLLKIFKGIVTLNLLKEDKYVKQLPGTHY